MRRHPYRLLASVAAVFAGVLWLAPRGFAVAQDFPRGSGLPGPPAPRADRTTDTVLDDTLGGTKIHPTLMARWAGRGDAERIKAWVFFTDKKIGSRQSYETALARVAAGYNPRAIERRRARRTGTGTEREDVESRRPPRRDLRSGSNRRRLAPPRPQLGHLRGLEAVPGSGKPTRDGTQRADRRTTEAEEGGTGCSVATSVGKSERANESD